MLLVFNQPLDVKNHFEVIPDASPWVERRHHRAGDVWTPVRDRATYVSWHKSLNPITPDSDKLKKWYGIYLFAADIPQPTLYVGIASNSTKSSEGVLTRLRKHRVKATGSHVGPEPTSGGGVHHTAKWREFAIQRFAYFGNRPDVLEDVRVVVSKFEGAETQAKSDLERFEADIVRNQSGVLDQIIEKLWPGMCAQHVRVLNGSTSRRILLSDDAFQLWSN
jgi:hypothetical protein